jgi:hypothetical protein
VEKTDNAVQSNTAPQILEFEQQAVQKLRKNADNKQQIKELLEEYAARYVAGYSFKS